MEKEIRRHFSKIGFAYLAGSIVIYAVQYLAAMAGKKFVPGGNGGCKRLLYLTDADDVWDFHAVYGLAGQQDSGPED